jgi:hypothetical protein
MSSTEYRDARFLTAGPAGWRRSYSRISWGAVIAGAIVAAATMLLLSFLGMAIGAGALRLSETGAAGLRGYGLGAGIWTAVDLILAMLFGGYVASRLSGTHSHLDGELHGITVWALGTLLATVLLAQLASLAVGTATVAAGPAVTAVAAASTGTLPQAGGQSLIDRLQQSLSAGSDPSQMTRSEIGSEITLLTGRLLANGQLTDPDRDRLTTLVAAQDDLTRAEAARRVARMQENATILLAQARNTADAAAAGVALGARAIFSALLLGLGAAMLGAWLGTRHARVLTPPALEPAYEPYGAGDVLRTVYEPPAAPARVDVVADAGRTVPVYLRNVRFPATKDELLRAARAVPGEPMALSRLERVPDRSYTSLDDLLSALMAIA